MKSLGPYLAASAFLLVGVVIGVSLCATLAPYLPHPPAPVPAVPPTPAPAKPPAPPEVPSRFLSPGWLSQELREQMQGVDLGEMNPDGLGVTGVLGHEWCADDRLHVYARVHASRNPKPGEFLQGIAHFRYRRLDLTRSGEARTAYLFQSVTLESCRKQPACVFLRIEPGEDD